MKSLIIAFSTYSRIPMPKITWDEESMKYSMCFFPFVGGVIGLCCYGIYTGLSVLEAGNILISAILTVLPVLLTGGIHVDGFLDTMDAKNSYRSKEEKLEILKDPHIGAFALIYGIVYFLLYFGLFSEMNQKAIALVALGYAYSRVLSGLSVVLFQKAKREGMAASTARASEKNVRWILVVEGVFCAAGFLLLHPLAGAGCVAAGVLCFLYYRNMAYRIFGGITGDLAGYFLQLCELWILLTAILLTHY